MNSFYALSTILYLLGLIKVASALYLCKHPKPFIKEGIVDSYTVSVICYQQYNGIIYVIMTELALTFYLCKHPKIFIDINIMLYSNIQTFGCYRILSNARTKYSAKHFVRRIQTLNMLQKFISLLFFVCLVIAINAEEETKDATSYMKGNGKHTV